MPKQKYQEYLEESWDLPPAVPLDCKVARLQTEQEILQRQNAELQNQAHQLLAALIARNHPPANNAE